MMKRMICTLLCLCILFCFSSCAKNTVSDTLPTNAEVYEIIIPNSLLSISGISELEYIASFDNETHDVYTDVQLIDDEVILYLTDTQRQNLINQVKDTIDIILEDYYQCNTNYSFIGDDDYKSITFIYDENISESLETKVLGAVFAKYAYLNVLEHKDPNWKIHLQIYNCHTNKLVIEGDLEKERVSWSQDDWARSYE